MDMKELKIIGITVKPFHRPAEKKEAIIINNSRAQEKEWNKT